MAIFETPQYKYWNHIKGCTRKFLYNYMIALAFICIEILAYTLYFCTSFQTSFKVNWKWIFEFSHQGALFMKSWILLLQIAIETKMKKSTSPQHQSLNLSQENRRIMIVMTLEYTTIARTQVSFFIYYDVRCELKGQHGVQR